MPTSRKNKHGSGKVRKPKQLVYDPTYSAALTEDLASTLKEKLSLKELIELENQLRRVVETEKHEATFNTHKTTWAVVLRVLHDQFGFEMEDKRKLYDGSMEYLRDIRDKRLSLQDMLDTLENEDGLRLTWEDED